MAKKRKIKSKKITKGTKRMPQKKSFAQREKEAISNIFSRKTKPREMPAAKIPEQMAKTSPAHREARAHLAEKKIKMNFSKSRFFEKIGRLLPDYFPEKAKELLIYNGIDDVHVESWAGKLIVKSIAAALILGIALAYLKSLSLPFALASIASIFFISFVGTFAMLSINADKRSKQIEQMLPSALQLMSANIRAGMTPDKAVWLAARPEFGALMSEIKRAGAETMGGVALTDAFINMSKRVRSRTLERTVKLIVEGIESGGELAKLLNETSAEIRAMELLQKEMEANVAMYSMFIVFASMVGAPFLLAISTFFVEMLTKLSSLSGLNAVAGAEAQKAGLSLAVLSTTVTPQFLLIFSIVIICATTFSAALLLGIIKDGNEKRGLEMAPIFVIVGLILFFIVRIGLSKAFAGVLG